MYCNCPGNLKSLDFFSSQDLSILDKTSLSFIEAFVLWCLVSVAFYKSVLLNNFEKFTIKYLRRVFLLRLKSSFIKNKLQHRCFYVNFANL